MSNNNAVVADSKQVMSANHTTADPTIPLTNNELQRFSSIINAPLINLATSLVETMNNQLDEVRAQYDQMMIRMTDAIAETSRQHNEEMALLRSRLDDLTDTFKRESATNRKQVYAISAKTNNPLFYSTMSDINQSRWKKQIGGRISGLCIKTGENEGNIYKTIYNAMADEGYNVRALLTNYITNHQGASIIDMCSCSDVLRYSFESKLDKLCYRSELAEIKKRSSVRVTNAIASRVPEEIRTIIAGSSATGRPMGRTYSRAWKQLCVAVPNLNHAKLVKNCLKKYGITRCNIWFAVAQDPDLVAALKNAVAQNS